MRLWQRWQTLLFLGAFAFMGLLVPILVWVSPKDSLASLLIRQVFSLMLAFVSSLPLLFVSLPALPEWKLAQPIHARTMTVFLWASGIADMLCLSILITLPAIISASIVLKGTVNVAAMMMLVVVVALNAALGAALVSLEMTGWRTRLALIGRLWRIWIWAILIGAGVSILLFSILSVAGIRFGWEFVRWVETPVGMAILLPLMPAYHAIKAAFDGVTAVPVLLTLFLAVFTAIMIWQALEVATPFCEATFLRSERRRRLTEMGEWGALPAKPIKSEIGFGSKATSLLWMYWLNWKRNFLWAGELIAIAFIICSLCVFILSAKSVSQPFAFTFAAILAAAIVVMTMPPSGSPPRLPEWLKSQPISVDEALVMLALPTALRAGLWALVISFALLLFSPEKVSAVNVLAFVLAAVAYGFGIDFMVRALKLLWQQDISFTASAAFSIGLIVSIGLLLAQLLSLTLTDYWLLGLLLSWAACVVSFLWAKERWLKEP
ncbi:MAG: hypothetical protein DFNUSKGM_000914 [Candidatus Fervidibacter sacchari]